MAFLKIGGGGEMTLCA